MLLSIPAIEVRRASKAFRADQLALDRIDLVVEPGECVALLGASGSGKSTLLRSLCGLETFTTAESEVLVQGQVLQRAGRMGAQARTLRRNTAIIFQQFNLVGRKSLLDNVLTGCLSKMPLWRAILGRYTREERKSALGALASVGLLDFHAQRASTLSGGQQQRAAIAKALVQGSPILLADEPVASLDPESTETVMRLLKRINQDHGRTLVISLHDVDLAKRYCQRAVALKHGKVLFDGPCADLTPALLHQVYGPHAAAVFHPPLSQGIHESGRAHAAPVAPIAQIAPIAPALASPCLSL